MKSDKEYKKIASGCWLWTGATFASGYGQTRRNYRERRAHRASWEVHRGPIPEGMCVLHKCDVKLCVNPDHLFLGTHAENMADMSRKGRVSRLGWGWKSLPKYKGQSE